jgi:hypothetical protein
VSLLSNNPCTDLAERAPTTSRTMRVYTFWLQEGDSYSGGCGRAVTQMRGHIVMH